MSVIELEKLTGSTPMEVALEIIKDATRYKSELYSLNGGKTFIVVANDGIKVDKLGKPIEVNGVRVVSYKMGENIYQLDIGDDKDYISVVIILPFHTVQLSKSPGEIKNELDKGGVVSIPPEVEVLDSYPSNIPDVPVRYYELESRMYHGVARYNEKSNVLTVELWDDSGEVVTLISF